MHQYLVVDPFMDKCNLDLLGYDVFVICYLLLLHFCNYMAKRGRDNHIPYEGERTYKGRETHRVVMIIVAEGFIEHRA